MESKNIVQYIILAAVVFLSIIGIVNMLKPQTALTDTKHKIDSVLQVVRASQEIISNQTKTINDLQQLNEDLKSKIHKTDSVNRLIKWTIDSKFSSTTKSLNELKKDIENIHIPVIR